MVIEDFDSVRGQVERGDAPFALGNFGLHRGQLLLRLLRSCFQIAHEGFLGVLRRPARTDECPLQVGRRRQGHTSPCRQPRFAPLMRAPPGAATPLTLDA